MSRTRSAAGMGTANNGRSGLAINFISVIAISNQSTDRSVPYHGLGLLPYLSNAATIIAVILFGDDNLDRALTQTAVVVGGLLSVANIHVVQFERLAGAHLLEWVFLLGSDFVDHHRPLLLFRARCFVRD